MTTIATMSAVLRLEEKPFGDGVKRTKRHISGLEKAMRDLGLSGDKIGMSIARPFLSMSVLAGMAKSAVNSLAAALERLATTKIDDVSILDETKVERFAWAVGELLTKLAGGGRLKRVEEIDALVEKWNEFSGVTSTRAAVEFHRMEQAMKAVEERTRKLGDLQAKINDTIAGGDDQTRARALKFAGENKELVQLEQRLDDVTKLRSKVDAILSQGKTASEKMAESQGVLNDAMRQGILTLEQYEAALKRLRQASGGAMVVNPLTARREAAPAPRASGDGTGPQAVALLRQILGQLQFDGANGAATRLR